MLTPRQTGDGLGQVLRIGSKYKRGRTLSLPLSLYDNQRTCSVELDSTRNYLFSTTNTTMTTAITNDDQRMPTAKFPRRNSAHSSMPGVKRFNTNSPIAMAAANPMAATIDQMIAKIILVTIDIISGPVPGSGGKPPCKKLPIV